MSTDPDAAHPPVSLEELTAVVSALDEALTALTARVISMRTTPAPPPPTSPAGPAGQQKAAPQERAWWWPALTAKDTAKAAERLGAWVQHALIARHPHYGQMLRPCWWRHPGVVDELSALRATWHGAYIGEGRDPAAAAEYLNRWLPAAMTRIEATFSRTNCTVEAGKDVHEDTDARYHRAQWTPAQVAEFLTAAPASAALSPNAM